MRLQLELLQDLLGLGLGLRDCLLGLRDRRASDLLGRLARALQHAAGLVPDPVQRVLDRRLR